MTDRLFGELLPEDLMRIAKAWHLESTPPSGQVINQEPSGRGQKKQAKPEKAKGPIDLGAKGVLESGDVPKGYYRGLGTGYNRF